MLHKIAAIALGLLCLAPAYTIIQIFRAPVMGGRRYYNATYPDIIAVSILAACGLCLCGYFIFSQK